MLTDTKVRSAKAREKPYKIFDERGLFLIVYPDRIDPETGKVVRQGAKGWRFRYKFGGREKLISFGNYPDTSLKLARSKRDDVRRQLADSIDPSAARQAEKHAHAHTLEALAREWLAAGCPGGRTRKAVSDDTTDQLRRRLVKYVFPYLGRWPIVDVTAPELLKVLRRIESNDKHETAHRVRSLCSRVFRYGIATGRAERDPAADLVGALTPTSAKNFPGITNPKRIGELLRAIDGYQGQPSVMAALELSPLVFVRPSELRAAEWSEFDLDGSEWRIPATRMKMRREHVVPLSKQALKTLNGLYMVTGRGHLLFPGLRSADRPISDNTLNAALRRLGFSKDEMTGHGFRTMASTRLNELGFPPEVIELQLAHTDQNKVRDAYNRALRMPERRTMMQAWADYLDGLRVDKRSKVRAIRG
jgi:integrase